MIPTPKAIIFDCDGTLLLTADLHFSAISQAVELQGGVMSWAWYAGKTGLGRHDLFKQFEVEFGGSFDHPELAAQSISLTLELAALARPIPRLPIWHGAATGCGRSQWQPTASVRL